MENETSIDIILLIVVGCLGMVILAATIILFVVFYQKKVLAQKNQMQLAENQYQRQLLQATLQVEEKERERIAKNIHDDIGTMLNVLKLNLTKVARNGNDKGLVERLTEENIQLLDESIQSIRNISKDLVSPTLVRLGYLKAIHELCRHITNSGQIVADLYYEQDSPDLQFPEGTETQLYRMTQEILNNIIKHAGAAEILIQYHKTDSHRIQIRHNGQGITDQDVQELWNDNKGLGLKSIRSRAQLINATVTYSAPPLSEQPCITVKIPLYEKN